MNKTNNQNNTNNTNNKILVKENFLLHLSTQGSSCIQLNGDYRSKVKYNIKNYLNFNDETIEYVTLQLPYAVLTNSNYIINEYNNKINFTYGGTTINGIITEGNYDIKSFISNIQTYFIPSNYFVITFSQITNKITITSTSTYQSLFPGSTWGFQVSTCDYIFGFTGTLLTTGTTLTMPRAMNFLPIPRYLIHCNLLNTGITLTNNSLNIKSSDILCSIPNIAKLNSQIIYEDNSNEYYIKNFENLDTLIITITDDNNNEINFNGISSYMLLKFNIFRYTQEKIENFKNIVEKNSQPKYENNNNIIYYE